jgi:hypothetical protein
MRWPRFFRRRRDEEADTRIYTASPQRAAKPVRPVPRNVPEPDSIFSDTGPLALEGEKTEDANPYETASWKLDPEKGARRVEDAKTVDRSGRAKNTSNNPYDTGTFRKGW